MSVPRALGHNELIDWAAEFVRGALATAPERPALVTNQDLQMLYLRPMVAYFEHCPSVMVAINQELIRSRQELIDLLRVRASWDREYRTLEDALHLGYDGLRTLDDLRRFRADLELLENRQPSTICRRFAEPLQASGLHAWWVGPMVMASALRHTMMEQLYPGPVCRPFLTALLSSGPRTVRDLTPSLSVSLPYDLSTQSRTSNKKNVEEAVRRAQEDIEAQFDNAGYRPFLARTYERDVALACLRLRNPRLWGWGRLHSLLRAEENYRAQIGNASPLPRTSRSGVVDAVRRVLALLEIESPKVGPGRPRRG